MSGWSKVTLSNAEEVAALVSEARGMVARGDLRAEGIGIFRAREGHALYFSPAATAAVDPRTGLCFEECARPDQMRVRPAVGAYDDPEAYDPDLPAPEPLDDGIDGLLRAAGF